MEHPPLLHDQAGAQPIPSVLQCRDARVVGRDLERDGARGKCFLQPADPRANHQYLAPVNLRDYSPTRRRRKALPVLAADGQPNTCASAPKPPGVPKSPWTCGPGAQQAWATQVRSQRSVAVPPTMQSRAPALLFRPASPESPYISPSHHKGRPIAGCQRSSDLTSEREPILQKSYHYPCAACRWWPRRSATSETTSGSMRVTSRLALFPLCPRTNIPLAPPGRSGHVSGPLIGDQVQAGASRVPPLLQRRDARVAAADLEGDGAGRNRLLELADAYRQRDCRRRRCVGGLALLDARLPVAEFPGGLPARGRAVRRPARPRLGRCGEHCGQLLEGPKSLPAQLIDPALDPASDHAVTSGISVCSPSCKLI